MALHARVGPSQGPGLPSPSSADYTPTRMKVSKSCVPSCFETVYDGYSKHASTTSCCQYDLCNSAGLATPASIIILNELNLKRENFRFNKMQDPVYTTCNIYTINVKMYVVPTKWF